MTDVGLYHLYQLIGSLFELVVDDNVIVHVCLASSPAAFCILSLMESSESVALPRSLSSKISMLGGAMKMSLASGILSRT